MNSLLTRFGEQSLWMGRYVERAENLARILDVTETFARDSHGTEDWLPVLRLHDDEDRFFALYEKPDAESVVRYYITDRRNSNSIAQSIFLARENARSLRHLLSLEIWFQLNVFCNWLLSLGDEDLALAKISGLCAEIKEGCALHLGIAERTLYRDQVWMFYQLGCQIERCDQTTRLVDIKYHALLPRADDVGSPLDLSQWNALLRSAAAYHGYRRVYPRHMTPQTVSGFILFDPHFPRSITRCVREIRTIVAELTALRELRHVAFPTESIERLEELASYSPARAIEYSLNAFLDRVQLEVGSLSRQIDETFFVHQAGPSHGVTKHARS